MKLLVTRPTVRGFLRLTQTALWMCAICLLGYCAFVAGDTWYFQQQQRGELEKALAAQRVGPEAPATLPAIAPPARITGQDGLIGRIEIERLGVSVIVMEGTSRKTLRRAVGHITGTALPGEPGNIGLSAHRDTFFRPLKDILPNDIILVTTPAGDFRYKVVNTEVVPPTEVEVLEPTGGEALTLVTCYPFYYTGPAPERFIVRAERVLPGGENAADGTP